MDFERGLRDDDLGLKQPWIKTVADRARAEYDNNLKAISTLLGRRPTPRTAPFTFKWMLKVHKRMFGDVWSWAGAIRYSQTRPGVPVFQITSSLLALERDIQYWIGAGWNDFVDQAATIHHRAVFIHPFRDGNGRWSRLLANIWLMRNGAGLTLWPDGMSRPQSPQRQAYMEALQAADQGDLRPLVALHRQYAQAGPA